MRVEGVVDVMIPNNPDQQITVHLQEPIAISNVVVGKKKADVIRMVPALYSLCGTAHAAAAAQALESASGNRADPQKLFIRQILVMMERVREHFLRITLSWPEISGGVPDRQTAKTILPLLADFRRALDPESRVFFETSYIAPLFSNAVSVLAKARASAEADIFGETLEQWLERVSPADLSAWCQSTNTPATNLIGDLFYKSLANLACVSPFYLSNVGNQLNSRAYIQEQTSKPETSILERRYQHLMLRDRERPTLLDRYLARLIDLAETIRELEGALRDPYSLEPGRVTPDGMGIAETARGRLTHLADVKEGLVVSYRILSPTHWNFDQNGIAAACLNALPKAPAAERLSMAHWVIGALDPCVRHEVRIN